MNRQVGEKCLIAGLTVSEGESMTIMVGSMVAGRQAGRHDSRVLAESLHVETTTRQKR